MCAMARSDPPPGTLPAPFPAAADALARVERMFDRCFGARANPWRHLGALGFHLFWIVVASGAYLYVVFDTSVAGAWHSGQALSMEQPWTGGLMRSLHRYASAAFATVVLLHVGCEFVRGRYAGARWFTWISGVPLIWLALGSGVVGYWLVWDQVAQFSAVATMEWLDAAGVFGVSLARNFLTPDSVDDRLFSLFVFLHIGLPLLLLLGMWVHIKRLSRPETVPARALGVGTLAALLALSVIAPVTSADPADALQVPPALALDWFYLAPHVLMYETSPQVLWAVAAVLTMALTACPLIGRSFRPPTAVVDPANCNGCRRCFADCPHGAIAMHPHPDARVGAELAVVDPSLCTSCGICAGACPSSTPFRSAKQLETGIDMPQQRVGALRKRLQDELARLSGPVRIVVFGCSNGIEIQTLRSADTATLTFMCAGQMPPSFVEYALRNGAHAVVVASCPEDGCAYRLGERWTLERLAGVREPHLRARVPRGRMRVIGCAPHERAELKRAIDALRAQCSLASGAQEAVHG